MWAIHKIKKIQLGKPDFDGLLRKGYMLIDMHVHTHVSDGANSAKRILEQAKKLGIGIAISDHEKISAAVKSFRNRQKVTVIPSIEVEAKTGEHFLYYFKNPHDLSRFHKAEIKGRECARSVEELLSAKKEYDCIVSWAHPAGWLAWHKRNITVNMKKIDCLELLNGHAALANIRKAARWVLKNRKPITGGSDVHALHQLGHVVTCAKARTIDEFFDKIRKRQALVVGQRINITSFMLLFPFRLALGKFNYFFIS